MSTSNIPRRRFGRTEIQMPVLACGGMRFQQSWKDEGPEVAEKENQANLEAVIERALGAGINHIETARGYGTSELQLGRILPSLPRESIIVQTKVGPEADPKQFLAGVERSLSLLGLEYVDLLSLHGINNEETAEWSMRPGGCLEAARQLQKDGRARHIGYSTHGAPALLERLNASGRFDYVNLHWYYVNPFNWNAVLAARASDMGVFIISPNDKGGKLYAPPEKLVRLCAPLSPMHFNDLFCLARTEVHTLSIGASRPGDFDEHLTALKDYDCASEKSAPIVDKLESELKQQLGADWVEGWHIGIPEHDEIPGGVNVREILRLWNFATALDMVEFGRMRYNLLGNGGHWFPGRKAENIDADAITRACHENPFAQRIPSILREAHDLLNGEEKKRLSES